MLKESFIACSRSAPLPPAANAAQLKDAGIFLHTFQPQPALKSTFKKSQTQQNCVAFNDSHIFAAQTQKAVVHVYNRDLGNQEAAVHFDQRVRSLTIAANGSVLALGTEGGQILLWEIYTGRQLSTPASHLQAVTSLVVDPSSNFLLSGSPDSLVLVWSLLDLQSFAAPSLSHELIKARHNLTGHSGPVTALAIGHSLASSNIALSASEDKTIAVWDYHDGIQLRTILLSDIPRCLTLDPADRAAFAGFDDGSAQRIDFFNTTSTQSAIHDVSLSSTPLQPPSSSRWAAVASDTGDSGSKKTLSLALSYDGTTLLSGHENGAINRWDVAAGRFAGTLAHHNGAPITSLAFETPDGLRPTPFVRATAIVKPRMHEAFSRVLTGDLEAGYNLASTLKPIANCHLNMIEVQGTGVGEDTLSWGAAELADWNSLGQSKRNGCANQVSVENQDFLMLDEHGQDQDEIRRLQQRIETMEQSQKRMSVDMATLRKDSSALKSRENAMLERRAKKNRLRRIKADREWDAIARRQQEAVGMIPEAMEQGEAESAKLENGDGDGDSASTTSDSGNSKS